MGEQSESKKIPAVNVVLPRGGMSLYGYVGQIEEHLVRQALDRAKGNRAKAAMLLGLNRTTLVQMIKRMGLTDYALPKPEPEIPSDSGEAIEIKPDGVTTEEEQTDGYRKTEEP